MLLAASLFIFSSCHKDEYGVSDSSNQEKLVKRTASAQTELDLMGQAAGMKSITYSNGNYLIDFYRDPEVYTVSINSFDKETLIDFNITSSAGTQNVLINPVNETINIGGVGNYTFAAFENYTISELEPVLKNIAIIATLQHELNPSTGNIFPDNGSGDSYTIALLGKFWGWVRNNIGEPGHVDSPDGPCFQYYTETYYVLWLKVYVTEVRAEEVPC